MSQTNVCVGPWFSPVYKSHGIQNVLLVLVKETSWFQISIQEKYDYRVTWEQRERKAMSEYDIWL